jgi:hypothetical protein
VDPVDTDPDPQHWFLEFSRGQNKEMQTKHLPNILVGVDGTCQKSAIATMCVL